MPIITKDQEISDLKKLNAKLREQLEKALQTIVSIKTQGTKL